jgi:hypothetical protein
LVETSDGGYALTGLTNSYGVGMADFWLIKTDASGNIEWNQTYGGTEPDIAFSVNQTSDGGYILAGETPSFGAGDYDFWLVKTDSSGNMEWNQTYGGTEVDWAWSMVVASDGGYALAGYTSSSGAGGYDFWLVKTDSSGNMEWNQTYGGSGSDQARSLVETSDGGYALAGSTSSFGAGESDFWLVKTDSSGNMEWNKTYGGTDYEEALSLVATSDGGYAIAGDVGSFATEKDDFWLVKTDSSGNMEWNKTYGEADYEWVSSLIATTDGGYTITGVTLSSGAGNKDFWLVKTDASGNMEWKKTYGGTNIDEAWSVIETSDGAFAIAGLTRSFGAGLQDFWLVKTGGCMHTHNLYTYEFDFSYGYGEYVVVISTNSTVGGFDFGIGQDQIAFNVTGPTGTTGIAEIIIPEDLTAGDFPVYLNEFMLLEDINYTKTYNGTHTIIEMSYSHSIHKIEITGTNVIPEYTSWILTSLLLTATLTILINKKKLSKN